MKGKNAVNLRETPFGLNDKDCQWVENTLQKMTLEEKVGQIFCPLGLSADYDYLNHLTQELHVGGMMYRPAEMKEIQSTHRYIQNSAKIPLLLAANTESGGDGMITEGTNMGKPLGIAATDNAENAYRLGYVACSEGAAVGMNWSFAPIIDIDREFHNPITNVRTFGSNPKKVAEFGSEYLRGAKEAGVAVSIKHFPGDGCDERDQHLLTSINDLSCEEWDATYGMIYKRLIDEGAQTVMVGHIAQPAYVKKINPNADKKTQLLPASLSKELITGLLREKLGFNGLISTDSTAMVGFLCAMRRKDAVPAAINAGCDMFLFNKDIDEDYGYLMDAVNEQIVPMERIDEAVTRILATKASLGLHTKKEKETIVPEPDVLSIVGNETFLKWREEIADTSITLVRDEQSLLPISPMQYKKVYLNIIQKSMNIRLKQVI